LFEYPFYAISIPEMWKVTSVEVAPPSITWVAGKTCFKSIIVVVSAAISVSSKSLTSEPLAPIERVKSAAAAPALHTAILVITVVVADGTV